MRRPALTALLALTLAVFGVLVGIETRAASLPGGWEQVGGNTAAPAQPALNGIVLALNTDKPGVMYVGGNFTDAGGDPNADYIAQWDGKTWKALGAPKLNAQVTSIAYRNGKVYAGGNFTAAGGNSAAGFLAVWDGTKWGPVCKPSGPGGNVDALEISGSTLYIGGSFQRGAGISNANYMLACDLNDRRRAGAGRRLHLELGGRARLRQPRHALCRRRVRRPRRHPRRRHGGRLQRRRRGALSGAAHLRKVEP